MPQYLTKVTLESLIKVFKYLCSCFPLLSFRSLLPTISLLKFPVQKTTFKTTFFDLFQQVEEINFNHSVSNHCLNENLNFVQSRGHVLVSTMTLSFQLPFSTRGHPSSACVRQEFNLKRGLRERVLSCQIYA